MTKKKVQARRRECKIEYVRKRWACIAAQTKSTTRTLDDRIEGIKDGESGVPQIPSRKRSSKKNAKNGSLSSPRIKDMNSKWSSSDQSTEGLKDIEPVGYAE